MLYPKGSKQPVSVWGSVMNVYKAPPSDVTPTPTPSITPTITLTPSITPTITLSPTSTPTPTISLTPSITPTLTSTPTNTPTISLSPTLTPTPSITPTLTSTPTNTPTSSLTPTPSITPSITPTNTLTPTNTGTPTPTPTQSPIPSGTTEANTYLSAVVAAGGTGITSTVSAATRTLFTSLVSNGLYNKITAMYPLLGGISASEKFNAKNPVDTNAAFRLTWSGGWTYTSSGATGNASNTFARTYISGTTLNRFSQHISYYSLRNTTTGNCIEMGGADTAGNSYTELALDLIAFGGNYRYGNINSVGTMVIDSPANSATTGFYIVSRTTDTTSYMSKNGSQILSGTTTTNSNQPYEIILGGRNDNGTFSYSTDRPIGFATIGSGLTPAEMTTLSSIVNTWATSIGRNTY